MGIPKLREQISLDLPTHRHLPVVDIIKMILDWGELSKDDIRLLWDLSEEDYEVLKGRLSKEKLIEAGPKGKGGFGVAGINGQTCRSLRRQVFNPATPLAASSF